MHPVDVRLSGGAAGAWAAAIIVLTTPYGTPFLVTVALVGVVAATWPRRRARHRHEWRGWASLTVALACLITVGVGLTARVQLERRQDTFAAVAELSGPRTVFTVRLTSEVRESTAGFGAHAHLVDVRTRHRSLPPDQPVYLLGADPHWRVGQVIAVQGALSTGGGDGSGFVRVSTVVSVRAPQGIYASVDRLRDGLRNASAHLPPHSRGLIPGIALGDTRRLPARLDEAMRTTSLTHITAVSGAHVAVVLGAVVVLMARTPVILRAIASGAVLGAMVFVVLPTPSVLRAATMGVITLLAMARRLPRMAFPVLMFTTIILLAHDPWLATSIGFALSVAATGGILLLSRPLGRMMGEHPLARAGAVPLAAQLACSPLLLTFDASLATYSVPANLLAMPALAPATILSLLSALASTISPAAAQPLAHLASYFTAWISAVAVFFSDLPGAKIPWMHGMIGIVALTLLLVCGGMWVLRTRAGRKG